MRLVPTMAPSGISEILRTVLSSSNSIMLTPAPAVEIKSLDAQAVEFELSFRVGDFSAVATARHEVYDLVYRHARAAGLVLAQPKESITVGTSRTTRCRRCGDARHGAAADRCCSFVRFLDRGGEADAGTDHDAPNLSQGRDACRTGH